MPTAAVAADGTTPVKKTRRRKKSVASEKYSTSAVQARFEEKGPAAVKPKSAPLAAANYSPAAIQARFEAKGVPIAIATSSSAAASSSSSKPAARITVVPIKPGARDKIQATTAATTAAIRADPAFDSMLEVSYFFTDDDKMVARSVFSTMESLKNSAEATKKVMGGMAEHFAGPPSMSMGTVDWHFKGPAAPVATPVSRVTIVPIKPGSQGAIMKKESMAAIEEGLKHPDMAGMIEVSVIFSGDTMLSRSLFTSMAALEGSVETQTRVMSTMKEHIAGPPTRLSGELAWHHTHGPPLGPVSERGAVSVALVPDDSYPAGFAVRIRPLLGISAGAPAEARCRVSYDVKGGARVDVVGLGRAEEATVQRLTAGFERAALDFAMASGASATSGSDADLWRKFVYWASKRDGGAGWYDELGRLGKPTTPERLVGVTGGARI